MIISWTAIHEKLSFDQVKKLDQINERRPTSTTTSADSAESGASSSVVPVTIAERVTVNKRTLNSTKSPSVNVINFNNNQVVNSSVDGDDVDDQGVDKQQQRKEENILTTLETSTSK